MSQESQEEPIPTSTDTGMKGMEGMKGMKDMPGMSMGASPTPAKPSKTIYTCRMHPEVRQDHPGKCTKCGMTLVPQKGGNP